MKKVLTISLYILKNWYKWWVQLLTIIGNVKIYKTPCFAIYNPEEYDYSIRGNQIRQICNLVKPGDIILRGYKHYLDGFLIPGKYSHVGIYIGEHTVVHAVAEGVSLTNIIDFTRCDRIAIFRPTFGQNDAIQKAKAFLGAKVPYDFGFERGISALYCFELCGECYDMLSIPKYTATKLCGIIKRHNVYLADSFFNSSDFRCILNYNPTLGIDYSEVQY